MDYNNIRLARLKALERERGLRGYSRLRQAELIALLQNNPPPQAAPRTRPTPAPQIMPPRPNRPPPSPLPQAPRALQPPTVERGPRTRGVQPAEAHSVRFGPDRPRQPELMRRLEGISTPPAPIASRRPPPKRDTEFKQYQLKPKGDLYGTLSDPETLQNCSSSDTGKTWPTSIKLCGLGTRSK